MSVKEAEIYPKWVLCRNHYQVQIRPMEIRDIPYLVEMLRSLEEKEIARLPCDIMDDSYPGIVAQQIREGNVYRLCAWLGDDEVVGSMALYRGSMRWVAHTGKVIQLTHPKYRRYGIATVLFDEMIPLAESNDITKVYCELTDAHKEGIKMVKSIGFKREGNLADHMMDSGGVYHNLYIYSMNLVAAKEVMNERMTQFMNLTHRI